jgi:hypothetical protein
MPMRGETWRGVPGLEGAFRVSNMGRVLSLPGPYRRAGLKSLDTSSSRQVFVNLRAGGRGGRFIVGRLVLAAFVGLCPPGMECCHEDGNPYNNRLSNLRWATHKENGEDMRHHGRCRKPRVLKEGDVEEMVRRCAAGETLRSVAEYFRVTPGYVSILIRGRVDLGRGRWAASRRAATHGR